MPFPAYYSLFHIICVTFDWLNEYAIFKTPVVPVLLMMMIIVGILLRLDIHIFQFVHVCI